MCTAFLFLPLGRARAEMLAVDAIKIAVIVVSDTHGGERGGEAVADPFVGQRQLFL